MQPQYSIRVLLLAFSLPACAWPQKLEQRETVRSTFQLTNPSAAKRLEVDNVHGSIRVTGYDGPEVHLVAERITQADSDEKMQQARQEVRLETGQQDNTVRLYVDGPFRCRCGDGSMNYRGWRHYGYQVKFDFELRAPHDTSLFLRTINEGDIKVENLSGSFDVENINGAIEMLEISGSGQVHALNRPLKVVFRKNPEAASYFRSLNGNVDLYFQPGLAADLLLKTFNGRIYSDLPVVHFPRKEAAAERRDGKFVYYRVTDTRVRDLMDLARDLLADNAGEVASCLRLDEEAAN